MKLFILPVLIFASLTSSAQFYYKDIVGTKESSALVKTYKENKVRRVLVNSYDASNVRVENLSIQQEFSPATNVLTTITQSDMTLPSFLKTYTDGNGKIYKTTDSTVEMVSTSIYTYNSEGQLLSITVASIDSSKKYPQTEEHIWQYKNGKVYRMLRIKNKIDTTTVDFKLDENGNVIEEQETKSGKTSIPFLYYYDNNNRLTDIVRFSSKARRLMPEYLFEYSADNQVIQRITVPGNSSEYTIWRYQFDQRGLKTKEAIYNKYKQLTGKIEYQYSFGS